MIRVYLGAADPEMELIESLLESASSQLDIEVVHATNNGFRVHPGNSYKSNNIEDIHVGKLDPEVWCVECGPAPSGAVIIDHHREGDYGYGAEPFDFLEASSVGQLIRLLIEVGWNPPWQSFEVTPDTWEFRDDEGGWRIAIADKTHHVGRVAVVPPRVVMIAAADHCLGAAYQGKCPGIDPRALAEFRAGERAVFQGRDVHEILADIESTTHALAIAPRIELAPGIVVADMRRDPPYPELPEAGTRMGISYISGPLACPDGRQKITCSGKEHEVRAFMGTWAPKNDITSIYGDPARGFAGGYLA